MNKEIHPFQPGLFFDFPVVGILRGIEHNWLIPLVRACLDGGLLNLEITMNTPGATLLVKKAVQFAGKNMNIGIGTVLTLEELNLSLEAGAQFVVTPVSDISIIRACRDREIPIFPGAMTPSEVALCWSEGATCVKIFPAEHLGPSYIKALKGPFPEIKLMPTGGVTPETLKAYFTAGASAFGVGSPLFPKSGMVEEDWPGIATNCRSFLKAWQERKD